MTPDLEALLHALAASGLRFVVIGGVAVAVHGYVRATKDLDVCPAGDRENLLVLAELLRELDAEQLEVGDFAPEELPFDPQDPDDLAKGGNPDADLLALRADRAALERLSEEHLLREDEV